MDPVGMALPLGSLYFINKYVDQKDPDHILYCRCFFGAIMGTLIVVCIVMKLVAAKCDFGGAEKDKTVDVVTQPAPPFGPKANDPPETQRVSNVK